MPGMDYVQVMTAVLVPATVWACWIDYSQRRVPNWLNGALAAMGVAAQYAYFGWTGVGQAALGMAVGLAVLIVPWLMHGMGAGDVKLMAAIGAWFGPWMCLAAFALGVVAGGVIAVTMITGAGKWGCALGNMGVIVAKVRSSRTVFSEFGSAHSFGSTSALLPYGIPLSIGTWLILWANYSGWWRVI